MDLSQLFRDHVAKVTDSVARTLSETKYDALVLGAGSQMVYYADDMEPPFRSNPHFAGMAPLRGPHHAIVVKPGVRPRLVRWAPKDYWYERAPFAQDFWTSEFEFDEADSADGVMAKIGPVGRAVFVGDDEARATAAGFAVNPQDVVKRLDWDRATKTAYEIDCLSRASMAGASGHIAAKAAFLKGESELGIHHAFLRGAGASEDLLPYPTIVCLDEKAASSITTRSDPPARAASCSSTRGPRTSVTAATSRGPVFRLRPTRSSRTSRRISMRSSCACVR